MSKIRILYISLIFTVSQVVGQSIKMDSLKNLDLSVLERKDRLEVLHIITRESINNEDSIIKYANKLINLASDKDTRYQYQGNLLLGQAYKNKGYYERSTQFLFKALKYGNSLGVSYKVTVQGVLGSVYGRVGDIQKLGEYFHLAIYNLKSESSIDSINVAIFCNNFAEAFFNNEIYDSAYMYYRDAYHWAELVNHEYMRKLILGNLGMVNVKLQKLDTARRQLESAINFLDRYSNLSTTLTFKMYLADIYIIEGKTQTAKALLQECLTLSEGNGLKEHLRDCYVRLSTLYQEGREYQKSLLTYKKFIAFRDSIQNLETVRKIADLRTEFEVGQKQAEVDLLTIQKRNQNIILFALTGFAFILVILAFIIYKYYQSKARTNRILETQKRELEALNQTKDKFFSIISHDLRGPVSSFHGISRMIKFLVQTKDTDQLLEITDDIDQSVERVSALLDNLLSWAMQQQGHFPNVPEKVDLKELADELVQTLKTMANGKNIELSSEIHSSVSLWVDKNTTMTILRNLVNNALKFTPEGGSVTISASEKGDFAAIRVSDTGVGIPKEKLHKLFRLQDKKSTYGTSGEKGLGLGLQLVYEFVEMNGGTIEVSSTEKEGTTFTVKLPLFESEQVEA